MIHRHSQVHRFSHSMQPNILVQSWSFKVKEILRPKPAGLDSLNAKSCVLLLVCIRSGSVLIVLVSVPLVGFLLPLLIDRDSLGHACVVALPLDLCLWREVQHTLHSLPM